MEYRNLKITFLAAFVITGFTIFPATAAVWDTTIVDQDGNAFSSSSLALDTDDQPRISYLSWNSSIENFTLQFAWFDTSGWHRETIESGLPYADPTSLVLDNEGNPAIGYFNGTSLNFARKDGDGWHIEEVNQQGWAPSLAWDTEGTPYISSTDLQKGYFSDLLFSWRDASGWHTETVDEEGRVGLFSSLALDSAGNPHISYTDDSEADLKYAWKDTDGWHYDTIDDRHGLQSSLKLDEAGNPSVSYAINSEWFLHFAWKNSSGWQHELVESEVVDWSPPSLALDRAGAPRISFMDGGRSEPNFAWKDGLGWHIETVETGFFGTFSSLALDHMDRPRISYLDNQHNFLRYAERTSVPSNSAPVAGDDWYSGTEDTILSVSRLGLGVLANDTDPEMNPVSAVLFSQASHGRVTLAPAGTFTYEPDTGFFGTDEFRYVATDGFLSSDPATVTLTIRRRSNSPPDAAGDAYSVDQDTLLNIPIPGVLGNDADPDQDELSAILVSGPAHGMVTLAPDGSFIYEPESGYYGADEFMYRATDGELSSDPVTVSLTIHEKIIIPEYPWAGIPLVILAGFALIAFFNRQGQRSG